jgi:3-oxoacyl-[acyl-carrier-protein] synthase II
VATGFEGIIAMTRRVVITGLGSVNPLGHDVESVWSAVKEGASGVDYTTVFDASRFPTKISAEVKDWDVSKVGEDPADWVERGRRTRFAIGAAIQAVNSSGIMDSGIDPLRFGAYLGCGEGFVDFDAFTSSVAAGVGEAGIEYSGFINRANTAFNHRLELENLPNMPASHICRMFNIQGPSVNTLTACAASSQAIGEATDFIKRGETEVMISGGAHSMIHPMGVTGFNLLTALSTNNDNPQGASRPFDRLRDGFVLGEGAGMVILEELEHARRRGAEIHGEVLGYGSTADAYRITDIHPEGRGEIACMRMAIKNAGLDPSDIDYVNAHGTSTQVNDRTETFSCREVFAGSPPPISSTKSMMGHLITAAGVTEAICCLMAIRDNVLPPTTNYENADPECDLDYIPNEARQADCRFALNNSFGFGGQNVTLVVGQYDG